MMMKKYLRTCIVVTGSALAIAGAAFMAEASRAERPVLGTAPFSVFSRPPSSGQQGLDLSIRTRQVLGIVGDGHVLGDELGRFDSRLVAFPAMSGRNVCYGLVPAESTDPGMTYCYPPGHPSMPRRLAEDHFSAVALASEGDARAGVQVFGVAFDDVVRLRVLVTGVWRPVSLASNGFYLDLPGMRLKEVTVIEATLGDGSTQTHNLLTGL